VVGIKRDARRKADDRGERAISQRRMNDEGDEGE